MTASRTMILVVAASVLRCATPATAEPITIYSNFGPAMSFDAGRFAGWTINGFLAPDIGQQAIAQRFTVPGDYLLDRVLLPLTVLSGPGAIDVALHADGGGLPGAVLETIPLRRLRTATE